MRKALAVLLAATLAACTSGTTEPTAPSSAAVQPSGAGTSVMHADVRRLLEDRTRFPQTPVSSPTTPISLADQLYRFAGGPSGMMVPWVNGWEVNLMPLVVFDERLRDLPRPVTVMVAPHPDKVPCRRAPLAGQDLSKPYVCPVTHKDPEQVPPEYILVEPAAFNELLKSVAAQQSQGVNGAWRVASIGAAVAYARYLRLIYKPFIGWPDGDVVDYCVAGISNRALFAKGKLLREDLGAAVSAVDTIFGGTDETRERRMIAFMDGFENGQLAHCAGY